MTPIDLTISDVAQIIVEQGLCGGRQFIVNDSNTSYGDYVLSFVCGNAPPASTVDAAANIPELEYIELYD